MKPQCPTIQPYRIFFPIGLVSGLVFAVVWPMHAWWNIGAYPGPIHATGMASSFIGSFIIGFLLTAIPRFSGTRPPTRALLISLTLLTLIEFGSLTLGQIQLAFQIGFLKFAFLAYFLLKARRLSHESFLPSFPWLFGGLCAAMASSLLNYFVLRLDLPEVYRQLANQFLFRGFLLSSFLGAGARIVPMLTGTALQVSHEEPHVFRHIHLISAPLFYFFLTLDSVLCGTPWERMALIAEASIITYLLITVWKLTHIPKGSMRGIGIWIFTWLIPLGFLLTALWPEQKLHLLHIVYVGGLFGTTLMVASHVLVNHENLNPLKLIRFWPLGFIIICVLLSLSTRLMAPFSDDYLLGLGYAGSFVFLTLIFWASWIIKSIACSHPYKFIEGLNETSPERKKC